jgi:hypothetical protein
VREGMEYASEVWGGSGVELAGMRVALQLYCTPCYIGAFLLP